MSKAPRKKAPWMLAGLLFAACFLGLQAASAQRLIAVSNAFSATQQAARVYVQSVDLAAGPLPGPFALPGVAPLGGLVAAPDNQHLLIATGWPESATESPSDARPSFTSVMRASPFEVLHSSQSIAPAGWREWPETSASLHTGDAIVMLGESRGPAAQWSGCLELRPWNSTRAAMEPAKVRWNLPGRPVGGLFPQPGSPRFLVLCQQAPGDAPLLMGGMLDAGELSESAGISSSLTRLNTAAAGMLLSADTRHLLVMLSGYEAGESSRERVSWVHQLDAATLATMGEAVRIPGDAAGSPPLAIEGDAVWALTRLASAQVAYAVRILCTPEGPQKDVQYILGGVQQHAALYVDSAAGWLAATRDSQLEFWPRGERTGEPIALSGNARLLGGAARRLLLGEGNRLLALDPETRAIAAGWTLQTGRIEMARGFSPPEDDGDGDGLSADAEKARSTDLANPDSDGDGLHDGIDPVPLVPSPRLSVPAWIALDGDAAGRELKALPIRFGSFGDLGWRVQYASEAMPWLVLHPRTGKGEGTCYLGLDPAVYRASPGTAGALSVELLDASNNVVGQAAVALRITAPRGPLRKILWLFETASQADEAEAPPLETLRTDLAAAPSYFSHTLRRGPLDTPLAPFSVVVLTAGAALEGAVTRQTVLDYVAEGGALLFVGDTPPSLPPAEATSGDIATQAPPEPAPGTALYSWLAPLDLRVLASPPSPAAQRAVVPHELTRNWGDFTFSRGELFEAAPATVLVSEENPSTGVFVAREHGYGRVALIASPEPFEATPPAPASRLFAQTLFEWLARANHEHFDMDGDLLTDELEDLNNNGTWDAGETSYLARDTDDDGLPDGVEDRNRNGTVEESETDPRNLDSDSDGIFDGADSMPLPPLGAPRILAVSPGSARAEGSLPVLITGRNFTPQSNFWFGERPAEWARLFNSGHAEVWLPDAGTDAGGQVDVRVSAPGGEEAVLARGFTYTPRGSLSIHMRSTATTEATHTKGLLQVNVSPIENTASSVELGRLSVSIRPSESVSIQWGVPRALSSNRGVRPQPVNSAPEVLALELRARSGAIPAGPLFEVPWEIAWTGTESTTLFQIENVVALTPHNGILSVQSESLQITPGAATPPTPTRAEN